MHTVEKKITHHCDCNSMVPHKETIKWVIFNGRFEEVDTLDTKEEAYALCSYLNGGDRPRTSGHD